MTTDDPGPIVQRLVLGAELRDLREAAGLTLDDVSKEIGWFDTKISKIENGDGKISDAEADRFLKLYKASTPTAKRVRQLAQEGRRMAQPARVTDWAKRYVALEASATEVKVWFGDLIPGLLQTEDYARALLSVSVIVSSADVDQLAKARAQRSARLTNPHPPLVWIVLGEEAIRRPVGGPEVLRGQLLRLRELAELDHVTLQVMPIAAGAHAGLGVAFTMLHLAAASATFAYVESLTSSDYLPRPRHTNAYSLVFDRLRVAALSDADSLTMINQHIAGLEK